jgi:hypothetical protein
VLSLQLAGGENEIKFSLCDIFINCVKSPRKEEFLLVVRLLLLWAWPIGLNRHYYNEFKSGQLIRMLYYLSSSLR